VEIFGNQNERNARYDELIESTKRPPFRIDLAKMKRWNGCPPLLHYQNEKDFDEFILALGACVQHGDALVECLVYRYGLEKWKIFQLKSERQKLMLLEHQLRHEFEKRDDQREAHRDDKKKNSAERADIIYEHLTRFITAGIICEEDTMEIRRNMLYKHKLDELSLVPKLHESLDLHTKIGALIDQSMVRLAALDRELAAHQIFLAEKADQRRWDAILEIAHPHLSDNI